MRRVSVSDSPSTSASSSNEMRSSLGTASRSTRNVLKWPMSDMTAPSWDISPAEYSRSVDAMASLLHRRSRASDSAGEPIIRAMMLTGSGIETSVVKSKASRVVC